VGGDLDLLLLVLVAVFAKTLFIDDLEIGSAQ
jgi:hypothetical protein